MAEVHKETIEFVTRAPVRAGAERTIDAGPDEIFDVLADTSSWAEWFPTITSAVLTSPEGGVGGTRTVHIGRVRVDEEFIVWDRPRRWGFTFVGLNVPFARRGVEVADLDPLDDGRTRVRYTMAIEPRFPRLLHGPFEKNASKGIGDGLAGLERYVTGG